MPKKKIYTVATAHLDTVWSWDLEETIEKYLYNTLTDNFRLFEKYPSYTFSFEGSYRYELMKEYYPELFEKMKEYIKKGRWHVCGSAFENGDVNIPSPEALIRNILIGNSYFEKEFGERSKDIFLPDCFGFGFALPSIAHHCNLLGFTTQKLAWGSAYKIPFDIGRWQGVDGKEIYACLNPHDYNYSFRKLRDWDFLLDKLKENEKYGLDLTCVFHGTGDRGGAPKEKSVKFTQKQAEKNGDSDIEIHCAFADEIFRDIDEGFTPEQKAALPVWKNELVMTNHAVGGYTSRSVGKRWNRRCEELADLAERAGVISEYLGVSDYNRQALTRSWKRFIAHQFHDDIPGTSCQRVYKRSWNDYAMSANQFKNELEASVSSISSLLDTSWCEGRAVCVFNPVEARRSGTVSLTLNGIRSEFVRVFDRDGNETTAQSKRLSDGGTQIIFCADMPSLGVKIYDIRESDIPCRAHSELEVGKNMLSNSKYTVKLNRNGDITSVKDKSLGNIELLKEPVSLGLFRYTGSKDWPAWEMNYSQAAKQADYIPEAVNSEIIENGKARVAVKVTQKHGKSTFENIIALTDNGKCVEVYSEIEWQSLKTMAKQKFAFTCADKKASFDLGLGVIERGNMNETLFEVPAQKWADITDSDGSYGVSVISECKYGWDKFNDNTLRLTVLHTPEKNYKIDSMQSFMDLGLNRYSFAIFSHSGKVGAQTQLAAREFVTPLTAYECQKHGGVLAGEYSFCDVSDNGVIIRAVKKAENTDEIIVRLNEGENRHIENFTLSLGGGVESAREIYADEEELRPAGVVGSKLVCSFKPYEIKSFALKLKKPSFAAEKAASRPVAMEFDKKFITRQNEKGDFLLNIPYEIIPEKINACGVQFTIKKDSYNAVLAKGQKIKLSPGSKRLLILCASLRNDKSVEFKADGTVKKAQINSMTERFARWDLYDFGETAYIKDGKLGWEATHAHSMSGNDIIAKSLCFYIEEIETDGCNEVTLPCDGDIIILAVSEAFESGARLVSEVFDKVENRRPFKFELTESELKTYKKFKKRRYLNDKDHFIRDNGRGADY